MRAAGLPRSTGKQLSHFQASGKEERGKGGVYRVSWSPQWPWRNRHCENRTSCWSGSLTPDLALRDNDSPGLTSPRAIHHRPDTSHHSLLLPGQEQTSLRAGATGSQRIPDTVSPVPADLTPGSHRNQVMETLTESLFGIPPFPHWQQDLWTAICSSLRNSSSLTSGSGPGRARVENQ